MRPLHFTRGDSSALPFLIREPSSRRTQFRLFRLWRSLSQLQRTLVYLLICFSFFAFVYSMLPDMESNSGYSLASSWRFRKPYLTNVQGIPKVISKVPFSNISERDSGQAVADVPKYPSFFGPQNNRQKAVVDAFKHAWKGYKTYAWGRDQLRPLSRSYQKWFDTGLTIVESLDTMLIMGLSQEFEEARRWVTESLSFDKDNYVNLFESTIRTLGGLLSAYHLTGDRAFAEKATDIGGRLSSAFNSPSGVPYSDVNIAQRIAKGADWHQYSSLSEVTTIQLEFRDLSRITGNTSFEEEAFKVSEHIHADGCRHKDGLCEMFISPETGMFKGGSAITMGARADSYYEYLLKQWLQTGKTIDWLKEDYMNAIDATKKHLMRRTKKSNLLFVGELLNGNRFSPKMDHLVCFLSGTLALGSINGMPQEHLEMAKELGETCWAMYQTATGLWPEIVYFNTNDESADDLFIKRHDSFCLLRPEAIESWFYLHRITGNKTYQEWGWKAFKAIEQHAKVANGYSSVDNVKQIPVKHRDLMETFFLAETLKYLYLLLADDQSELPLTEYVFNTEAHPLPIYKH
ncbi:hypothetical protein AB6A40_006211 [Gnathostoma spinigerum]|uniref:alpha-1,2-Mannosidase n=1 Tax=Gnathostoma spinigerum TaxID=75299 RepID=A0ABD6ES27_9BILA